MNVSLRKKILGITFLSVILIATLISAISIRNIIARGDERLQLYRATLLSERQNQIKGYVEMAARVIAGLPPDQALQVARSMRYGKDGYIWVNDFNNIMLEHPDPRLEGKDETNLRDPNGVYILQAITNTCRSKGEGFVEYMWKAPGEETLKPKISYAKAIPARRWIVGTGIYVDDIEAKVGKEQAAINQQVATSLFQYGFITILFLAGMLLISTYLVKRYISGPIEAITQALRHFDNDLTLTIPISTADETAELASWFNEQIRSLHATISKVAGITAQVDDQIKEIALNMDQQAGFTTQLSSSVVEISSTMEEFSSTATQIAQHSQGVVERADKTLADTKHGASEVENLTFKIMDISATIQSNLNEIVELGRKSKEINKIMEIINNIANQTKLIAFNAALEAASAGEAGKRFGVVAVEIRRLADSVVESTGEIEGKITEILDAVNRLVMSSEKSSQLIQEGQEYASHTVAILIESVDGVDETTSSARQISLSTQQQQIASSQVVLALKEIEEGVRFATDSVQQTNRITGTLSALSEQLRALVETFNLGQRTDTTTPHTTKERSEP